MHQHTDALALDLARKAQHLRMDVLDMVTRTGTGHLGGPYSAAEILSALYFHQLRIDPARPDWPERDRFLLSKGHAAPILYAVLARRGFYPDGGARHLSALPDAPRGTPGPQAARRGDGGRTAGPRCRRGAGMAWSLTRGVPKPSAASAPSAMAARARVYVLLGDGELDAGVVWEGAMFAAKYRLGNLTAIVDANGIQQTGATADVMPTEPLAEKWSAFGWHVQEVHGHNVREVLDALDRADEVHARPSVIIARTTKGRGVSYMEYDHRWHGGMVPTPEQYEQAMRELRASLAELGEEAEA